MVTITDAQKDEDAGKINRLPHIDGLFPENGKDFERPFAFDKKVIVLIARVSAGATQSNHVMDVLLGLLTNPNDGLAKILRRNYVFVLIPMVNPDGVSRGHSRLDALG